LTPGAGAEAGRRPSAAADGKKRASWPASCLDRRLSSPSAETLGRPSRRQRVLTSVLPLMNRNHAL